MEWIVEERKHILLDTLKNKEEVDHPRNEKINVNNIMRERGIKRGIGKIDNYGN